MQQKPVEHLVHTYRQSNTFTQSVKKIKSAADNTVPDGKCEQGFTCIMWSSVTLYDQVTLVLTYDSNSCFRK